MTQFSREDLIAGSSEVWASWLRSAVLAFTAQIPLSRKVGAFAPLYVDPETASPAGEIFNQIRILMTEPSGAPANAAIEVLRSWAPDLDGWRGAALLLQLATRLHARGLYRATMMLLARAVDLPQAPKQDLAYLAARAAAARFRRSEVEDLCRTLWQLDLLDPEIAGDLALIFAREDFGGLVDLPQTIVRAIPGLTADPNEGLYVEAIASSLLVEFPSNELARCLANERQEDNVYAALRRRLAERTVPWALADYDGDAVAGALTADDAATNAEFIERTDVLQELGNVIQLSNYLGRRG